MVLIAVAIVVLAGLLVWLLNELLDDRLRIEPEWEDCGLTLQRRIR